MSKVRNNDHSTHTFVVVTDLYGKMICQGCADRWNQWQADHPIVKPSSYPQRLTTQTAVIKAWSKRSDKEVAKRVQAFNDLREVMGGSGTAAGGMDFEGCVLKGEVARRQAQRESKATMRKWLAKANAVRDRAK